VQKPLLTFQLAKQKLEEEIAAAGDISYSIVRPTAFFKSLAGKGSYHPKVCLVVSPNQLTSNGHLTNHLLVLGQFCYHLLCGVWSFYQTNSHQDWGVGSSHLSTLYVLCINPPSLCRSTEAVVRTLNHTLKAFPSLVRCSSCSRVLKLSCPWCVRLRALA